MYHKFIISKKNQPLLLALGGCLEEKNRQINGSYVLIFVKKFKI